MMMNGMIMSSIILAVTGGKINNDLYGGEEIWISMTFDGESNKKRTRKFKKARIFLNITYKPKTTGWKKTKRNMERIWQIFMVFISICC